MDDQLDAIDVGMSAANSKHAGQKVPPAPAPKLRRVFDTRPGSKPILGARRGGASSLVAAGAPLHPGAGDTAASLIKVLIGSALVAGPVAVAIFLPIPFGLAGSIAMLVCLVMAIVSCCC